MVPSEGDPMAFTVGELARLTGITVRALHHYDEIGLVVPSQRTAAGYRLYDDADVIRLQQVLLFRELGLPLDEIAFAIDEAGTREELLRKHREVLVECFYRGRSVAEAAVVLGIPTGTVKSRTHYAVRALRLVLDEMGVTR